jgi:MFS family permease
MSKSRTIAWGMWAIASTFYAYQYIMRVMPNIMIENIMQRFDMDATLFGQFAGIYYIGYCLMHIPVGIMLDRYGPRKVMSICILMIVIGLLPMVFTDYWVYPIVGRALIGMASSAAILGTFKVIRMAFSEKNFPRMLSFAVTIGLIGAIFGGEPVSYMFNTLGDKAVVEIFAALGIFLAIVTYFIMPDIEHTPQGSVFSHVKEVLSNKRVIWICLSAGFMVGPLEGFADVWGSEFFKQVYHFDQKVASTLPSMIFMGMLVGAPVLTFIGDKTKNYLGTIIGAGIVMTIGFIALLSGDLTPNVITLGFIIIGVSCAYQILAIYKASTYVPDHVVGLTTAVANMIIMSFGYAFHSIIGTVIDWSGGTSVGQAFVYGITVIPVMLAIGIIGFSVLFVQERSKREA